MLLEDIKESITSLNEDDLEEMYERFCIEFNTTSVDDFVLSLYVKDHITSDELKKVRVQEKIDVTAVASVWGGDAKAEKISKAGYQPAEEPYSIMQSIDEGAMGEILLAKDNELGRTVAYKKIHPHVAEVPSYMKRFFMEAQVTAQLQHPNIIPIYNLMAEGDQVGYTMKLIEGKTFKELIQEAKTQWDEDGKVDTAHSLSAFVDHFLKVCDALHYAHRKGVVHRDLKPLNIMVGPHNEVYVMDWGIAKIVNVNTSTFSDATKVIKADDVQDTEQKEAADDDKTKIGELLGTPVYMSPEQASGQNDTLDHRSDLYSLGLILFELITLRRATAGNNQSTLISNAIKAQISAPVPYVKGMPIPKELIAIVKKATRKNPNERYNTVKDFAEDIRSFLHGDAISAKPDTIGQKMMRWISRHRVAAMNITAYIIIASVGVAAWSLYEREQARVAAQLQSQKASRFLTGIGTKAQLIDAHFLQFEAILEGLASGATNLLVRGNPDPSPFYDQLDLADPKLAPPDYTFSEVYGFPISIGWHSYKLAPGVALATVEPLVRTLNPLRHSFKRLLLKSHDEYVEPDDLENAQRLIRDEGLPLVWAYVGLKEGIFAEYPGKTGYPAAFDPRNRPWYRETLAQKGSSCWRQPYIDVGGRGVLLPCTSILHDETGKFLGVAGVEMTLDYVRHELMAMPRVSGITDIFLLDEEGRIIVDASEQAKSYERGTLINSSRDLKPYWNQKVVRNISAGNSGHVDYEEAGSKKVLAYYRLNSIGWYYLVEAQLNELSLVESGNEKL